MEPQQKLKLTRVLMLLKAGAPLVALFYTLIFLPQIELIPLAMVTTIIIPIIWVS